MTALVGSTSSTSSVPEKLFTPFSDDIVFLDAEFTGMDACNHDLIAVAMVSLDGEREMYFELPYDATKVSDWTREHVIPFLQGKEAEVTHEEAREMIRGFCGSSQPHVVATVNQHDMAFFHALFAGEEEPIHHIPIDFASILFGMGLSPARTLDDEKVYFYAQFGIDLAEYNMHQALDDTRLMRDLYIKLSRPSIH